MHRNIFECTLDIYKDSPWGVPGAVRCLFSLTERLIPAAEMLFQGIDFLLFAAFPDGGDEAFGGEGEV